jgi:tRNA threonylcarbamoyl adenosine modification protein (Sua5/YciO/YrdC/YwlC family)
MLLKVYPENPAPRHISMIVECLKNDGVIIYPTDTVYGIGCDINSTKAINKVCQILNKRPDKSNFSFICKDITDVSNYAHQIDNTTFKAMRRALPGPYTFILHAKSIVPKLFKSNKKTVGVRVPDNNICLQIVTALGNPIMTNSIYDENEIVEYTTDPSLIHDKFGHLVDFVIDGGFGKNIPSTIIDCTGEVPEIIREGAGTSEIF